MSMAASAHYHCATLSLPRAGSRVRRGSAFSSNPFHSHLNPTPLLSFPASSHSIDGRLSLPNATLRSLKVLSMRDSRSPAVTKDTWENSVINCETPVLVEFYASWCGPCRMVHRVIDELAVEYAGRLKCFVLNTDDDLQIAEKYEIKAVPVVLLFKNGEKCESVVGTMPKEFYVAAIERVLKS